VVQLPLLCAQTSRLFGAVGPWEDIRLSLRDRSPRQQYVFSVLLRGRNFMSQELFGRLEVEERVSIHQVNKSIQSKSVRQ
jgi:hypothetical protein